MEQQITEAIAQFKAPITGAVFVIFGEDAMKVVRIGETPELAEFKQEVDIAYSA